MLSGPRQLPIAYSTVLLNLTATDGKLARVSERGYYIASLSMQRVMNAS